MGRDLLGEGLDSSVYPLLAIGYLFRQTGTSEILDRKLVKSGKFPECLKYLQVKYFKCIVNECVRGGMNERRN